MAIVTEKLLTAEEFGQMPDPGYPTELVRGRIVAMNPPKFPHGVVCGNIYHLVRTFADRNDLGRVLPNNSGIITERGPDTVRGADVAFYSYTRLPRHLIPQDYPPVAPDLVFEVRSPSDHSSEIPRKVAEYLSIGVLRVCVVDPQRRTVTVYSPDQPEERLGEEGELSLPDVLPGFSVPIARFFD